MARYKWLFPQLIILLALLLQSLYLVELAESFPDSFGQRPFCGVDAEAHVFRASGLLDGSVPGQRPFSFIPGYPIYLAIMRSAWGESLLLPIYVQALGQLLAVAALYGIGRMLFSPLAGALAALGLATYSYTIYYLPCFDQSLLTLPFLTLAIFFLVKYALSLEKAPQHQSLSRYWWLLAAGLTLAAATLSRPTILLLYPVILAWLFLLIPIRNLVWSQTGPGRHRQWRRLLGTFLIGFTLLVMPFLIAVAPITWHNYRVSGQFILMSENFGVNLFTGNNPDASGLDTLAHVQGQPAELRFREIMTRVGRGETTLALEAGRYISQHPGDWLALMTRKAWLWFGETDERLVTPVFPLAVNESRTLTPLPVEWQAAVIVALFGVLLVRGRSFHGEVLLWLLYGTFSVATVLFFIQLRFRLPMAIFIFLSAGAILASARTWRSCRPRRFWFTLVMLLLLYPLVPSLWIFILLFAGFGLWPDQPSLAQLRGSSSRTAIWPRLKRYAAGLYPSFGILLVIGLYLLLVGWWLRAQTLAADVSQTIDYYLGPPLAASGVLGQTFQMDCAGLNHIDVTLGVFNENHDQPVTFYLASDTQVQNIIYSETFDGSTVSDFQTRNFHFEPIPDSANQTYFFFISSPTSTPQNTVTARGYTDTPVDRYPAGAAFAGQPGALQQFEADIAFGAYCDLTTWQKMWHVFETN